MKRYFCIIILGVVALAMQARSYTVDEIPNVQLSDSERLLVNPDGIVDASAAARIDSLLVDLRRRTSMEVVAVVIDDISPEDENVEEFATRLFNKWGIGKKDKHNGLLILVVKDRRKVRLQPGYGAEGVFPDIVCSHIVQRDMIPYFKEGDYSAGVLAGVNRVYELATDPAVAEELKSSLADASAEDDDLFAFYLWLGVFIAAVMLVVYLVKVVTLSRLQADDSTRYAQLQKLNLVFLVLSVLFIAIPLPVFLLLRWTMHHLRNHARNCPNCGARMHKLDEETDNEYLTAAQDKEERIGSVDYDVWLCPDCNATEINSFKSASTVYTQCPRCGALTLRPTAKVVLRQPSTQHEGVGETHYTCVNCGNKTVKQYKIPRKTNDGAIAAAAVLGGMAAGRGSGGGGFGGGHGGGFGGGMTGGGGATGGW